MSTRAIMKHIQREMDELRASIGEHTDRARRVVRVFWRVRNTEGRELASGASVWTGSLYPPEVHAAVQAIRDAIERGEL